MRLSILLAIGLTTLLVAAAPASAGTVCASGPTATFAAGDVESLCGGASVAGETNKLTVAGDGAGNVVFTDTSPIADGDGAGGCTASGNTASCPGTGYVFDLGGGDDSATVGSVASSGPSTGGLGKDTLTGGPLSDQLSGGDGTDALFGGDGQDFLHGGDGADGVDGGSGDDVLFGDDGPDALTGGTGRDSLLGDDGPDALTGGTGRDSLLGGAGGDVE